MHRTDRSIAKRTSESGQLLLDPLDDGEAVPLGNHVLLTPTESIDFTDGPYGLFVKWTPLCLLSS